MKLKGINTFEQHLEKVVLGVAVLAVAGIVGVQFLSAPTIKVGPKSASYGEVDGLLDRKAKELEGRLGEGAVSIEIPADTVTLAAPGFSEAIAAGVSPAQSLTVTAPNFNGQLVKTGGSSVDVWYYVPTVPSLKMKGVQETADALTADAAKQAAKASKVIADRPDFQSIDGPKDVVWTTPYARIDLKGLRSELTGSRKDATPPLMAIPGVWYQDKPFVVDIVFERRERAGGESWSAPVTVPVFAARPEELNFRGRIDTASAGLRDDVFALLGSDDNQLEILQPAFYDTVNQQFVSPALLAGPSGDDAPAAGAAVDAGSARRRLQIQTQLQERQRRAQVLRGELEKLGGPWDEDLERKKEADRKRDEAERKKAEESGKGGGGGSGNKGPGGGPGGGGSFSGKNNAESDNEAKDAKKKAAERKSKTMALRRIEADIASFEKELGAEPSSGQPVAKQQALALASLDELIVWAHDLEVVPGRTYQYRCVARVYNPFFGKGNQLVNEQRSKHLDAAFAMDSVASEWGSSVTVSSDVQFFVTRALVADGAMAAGTAQIEVYKLLGGQWRRSEASIQPGERIGKVDARSGTSVDFSTDYYVIDVVEDLDTTRAGTGASKERRTGMVVVGTMSGSDTEIRIPANDIDDPDRVRLRAQADASAASSKSGAETPTDGGGKPGLGGSGAGPGGAGGPAGGGSSGPGGGKSGGGKSGPGGGK
jgi:uncharacterized membrane protein YgcG